MKHTITKQFAFSASHQLHGLSAGHPCSRLHGHNYVVTVELQSDRLDDKGMVIDYNELAVFGRLLEDRFDHRHLNNDVREIGNPTAENLAQHLATWLAREFPMTARAVTVSETPKTTARCELW